MNPSSLPLPLWEVQQDLVSYPVCASRRNVTFIILNYYLCLCPSVSLASHTVMFQCLSFLSRRISTSRYCQNMPLRPTDVPRISIPDKMEINPTVTENSICELLDGCVKLLESEKGISVKCRVAGGWVRDKVPIHLGSISD